MENEVTPAIARMTEINMVPVRAGVDLLDMARMADNPAMVLAYSENMKAHLDKISYWARGELIDTGGKVYDEEEDIFGSFG